MRVIAEVRRRSVGSPMVAIARRRQDAVRRRFDAPFRTGRLRGTLPRLAQTSTETYAGGDGLVCALIRWITVTSSGG